MTLREIIQGHPTLFYRQHWYEGEPFMDAAPTGEVSSRFVLFSSQTMTPENRAPVRAADLAALYVETPGDERWRRFIWTDDFDQYGQRVYVGGVGEFGIDAFQVHRHLQVDERWGWVL